MKKTILILVAALAAGTAGVAHAAGGEATPSYLRGGHLAIDPATCRFIDPLPDPAPNAQERYARFEDAYQDAFNRCIRKHLTTTLTVAPATPDKCWTEVPAHPTLRQLRAYIDAVQDCENPSVEGGTK